MSKSAMNNSLFDDEFLAQISLQKEEVECQSVKQQVAASSLSLNSLDVKNIQVETLWQGCLDELALELSEAELNQWLKPLKPKLQATTLILFAINGVFIKHIRTQYLPIIQRILARLNPKITAVELQVMSLAPSLSNKPTQKRSPTKANVPSLKLEGDLIDARLTFETFVRGKANGLAYSVCLDLAKNAGQPKGDQDAHLLFIYGSSGLGKTHLMQAVAHRYQKLGLGFYYFTKDRFFRATQEAFRDGMIDKFVKNICKADLLIVDDVHLINNKSGPKVSQILMTLFGEFTKGNKRIILASDKPPSQMEDFDARFLSRFSGGMSLAVEPPDIETRVQILQKKAAALSLELPKECAIFIAQNVPPDVRALEGALTQVSINASMAQSPISLTVVRHAIKDRIEARAKAVNAENIRDVVAEYYGVAIKELVGKKRARTIARPRQMAMALIRELTQDSFPEIGQVFGGRDHTTVMHACDQIAKLRLDDPVIEKDYQSLLVTLQIT